MNKVRFLVGTKIMTIFVLFTFIIIFSGFFLFQTMQEYKVNVDESRNFYSPCISLLNDLSYNVTKSNELILIWIYIEKNRNTNSKNLLDNIIAYKLPFLVEKLDKYKKYFSKEQKELYHLIKTDLDVFTVHYTEIMIKLEHESDYENENILSEIKNKFGSENEFTKSSLNLEEQIFKLELLLKKEQKQKQEALIKLDESKKLSIILRAVTLFLIVLVFAYLTVSRIILPIHKIKYAVTGLSKGILDNHLEINQNDEIGDIANAINKLSGGLKTTAQFGQELGKGNFDMDFKPLSERDILGNSLLTTKNNLQEAEKERQINQENERQRNWSSTGVAKFSEHLRNNNNNLDKFAYVLISELVKYLDVQMGGFFLVIQDKSEGVVLELKASYAYELFEDVSKKVKPGETLVGQCYLEQESIYITQVPANYIQILSGLGNETPGAILLSPIKNETEIFGVIELASFKEFKEYQIQFVENICQSIAGTIAVIKNNEHTEKLLQESQSMANQLASQEEEMRQTLEIMQSTQLEMEHQRQNEKENEEIIKDAYRKEIKELKQKLGAKIEQIDGQNLQLNNTLSAIENSTGMAHITLEGTFIQVNSKYLEIAQCTSDKIIGKNIKDFMPKEIVEQNEFKTFWENLMQGKVQSGGHQYFFNNKEIWLYETFTPIKNTDNQTEHIIILCNDISKVRINQDEKNKLIDELKQKILNLENKI